jgi:hypothetical protein
MDLRQVAQDPDFQKLPETEKLKALAEIDPDLARLHPTEQLKALADLSRPAIAPAAVTNPSEQPALEGLSNKSKELTKKYLPWMYDDVKNAKTPEEHPANKGVLQPGSPSSIATAGIGAGKATEIGTPWSGTGLMGDIKQAGAEFANELPGIGQATGTAAGMGTALATEGALGPVAIPAGAGAGRIVGEAGKSVLQNLLGMKTAYPTAGELGESGVQGAEQGAIDAVTGKLLPAFGGTRPLESLESQIPAGSTPFARTEKYLTKRVLQPSAKSLGKSTEAVSAENIPIYGGKGAETVANAKKVLSNQVESHIGDAEMAGKTVSSGRIEREISNLSNSLMEKSDTMDDALEILNYWKKFKDLHPEEELAPSQAHEIKKFIYKKIPEKYWAGGEGYDPVMDARKKAGTAIMKQLEEIAPEIKPLNKQLGNYIKASEDVTRATDRITGEPLRKRAAGRIKEATAKGLRALRSEGNPEMPEAARSEQLTRMGSPIQTLEDMFGVRYAAPEAEAGAAPLQLTPDAGKFRTGELSMEPSERAMMARPAQLPPPPRQLPAPTGGPQQEFPNMMKYGEYGTNPEEVSMGKAVLGKAVAPEYPTLMEEAATRTAPTMNVTPQGTVFTNEPMTSVKGYGEYPINPEPQGPKPALGDIIARMSEGDRDRLLAFMAEVEAKNAAARAAAPPTMEFPQSFPNLSKILKQTKGQ